MAVFFRSEWLMRLPVDIDVSQRHRCENRSHMLVETAFRTGLPFARFPALIIFRVCSRSESGTHYLDLARVTAASGADRELYIVWERASGDGLVWAKPMHEALGVSGASSWPAWTTAQEQLKRHGARLCTPAEKRVLARPGVGATRRDVLVISISGACQWLRSVSEQTAAGQLERHQQPPPPATAQNGGRAAERDGAASLLRLHHMPAIPNTANTAQPLVSCHVVPALQADWRIAHRRVCRARSLSLSCLRVF